ncbi:phosphatidate phosphatase LPIN2-like isoform X2 [Gigantopelta aegis]|uniref:phosphatidate phosphatase LPIN2-like isoform X2 n=1 Tax=Gigantopelta aegis TaxID=1735272 RepID=UPI001B88802A|nr:phosphatidate phosphatase LPIN2-like isoform X2 [Gigantopelta aegis]
MSIGIVGRFLSNVKGLYNEINSATLTGAIDVIIVQQCDGSFQSSPFHVRFGKMGVIRARQKVVDIEINGEPVDLQMKLGEAGEAFFVEEIVESFEEVPPYLATSPIPSTSVLMKEGLTMQQSDRSKVEQWQQTSLKELIKDGQSHDSDKYNIIQNILHKDLKSDSSHDELSQVKGVVPRRKVFKKKKQKSGKSSPRVLQVQSAENDSIFELEVSHSSEEELEAHLSKSASMPLTEIQLLPDEWTHPKMASLRRNATYDNFLHPLSEPEVEISPPISPLPTRPPSPKSDTEVDLQHTEDSKIMMLMEDSATWEWGSFPTKPPSEANDSLDVIDNASVMRKDTSLEQKVDFLKEKDKGIYLTELEDPEIAKIYLGDRREFKEDDSESGRGASLPQSPHSVEGAIGGPPVNFLESEVRHLGRVSLSLCGGLSDPHGISLNTFMQKVVTFDDISENPNMINNPDLVVKILDKYYNWSTAAPMILSQMVFHKDLPEKTSQMLVKEHMPKKEKKKTGGVTSWFSWRRNNPDSTADPEVSMGTTNTTNSSVQSVLSDSETVTAKSNDANFEESTHSSAPTSLTSTPKKMKAPYTSRTRDTDVISSEPDTDQSEREAVSPSTSDSIKIDITDENGIKAEKYKKTLRLSSHQIAKLNLREGQNEISFSVTTQYQGTTRCYSHIYLWKYNDLIVISDIDGTITKSDVLGQILPIIGRDWSQSGVAELFTRIRENGYKLLYLSSRAIGQSNSTKNMLRGIKQGDLALPEGPLLLNPTSLISAFHRLGVSHGTNEKYREVIFQLFGGGKRIVTNFIVFDQKCSKMFFLLT